MRILSIAFLFFSSAAFAGTQIMFSKDGSKATVTLLAFSVNPDATAMFDALAQPAQDMNGKVIKHLEFKAVGGAPLFNVECVFSKLVGNTGSCMVVMNASPALAMDPRNGRAKLELTGQDAEFAAAAFVAPMSGDEIYRSSDAHLVVRAARGEDGRARNFQITYGY